jgi:hypothetical protein
MRNDVKNDKKAAREADARVAWAEHEAKQAAVDENMKRLRAERLAREAARAGAPVSTKPKTRK